jgi:hypothetical protein
MGDEFWGAPQTEIQIPLSITGVNAKTYGFRQKPPRWHSNHGKSIVTGILKVRTNGLAIHATPAMIAMLVGNGLKR